jgi:hypothetical protein
LFDHERFDVYSFEDTPLNGDCYIIDEVYIKEYEQSMIDFFNGKAYESVGYVGFVAPNKVHTNSIELSWYPNIHTRFHEVVIKLPKEAYITCVGCWQCDEKPHIFVKSNWLKSVYLRLYSVFVLVDAIGVKEALQDGRLSREKLIFLREEVDNLSKQYVDISFISFADSILLKTNWTVGHYESDVQYTYNPEVFIEIVKELQSIYRNTLGLSVYAVITQGSNEYYDDPLLHISDTQNHICLNSLGIPFAELMAIQNTVRSSIRRKIHEPAELYMDKLFYNSLKFKLEFYKQKRNKNKYREKMMGEDSFYYYGQCQYILDNLE